MGDNTCSSLPVEPPHAPARHVPPACSRRHLGRKFSFSTHHCPSARHLSHGVLSCAAGNRRAAGHPAVAAHALGFPRQAGVVPGAGRDQFRLAVRTVLGGRAAAAGWLFGDLQCHHTNDGRADRRLVLRRGVDARQDYRRFQRARRRGIADANRPGAIRHGAAARRTGMPGRHRLLWLRRLSHPPLDQPGRRPGQRSGRVR